MLDPSAAWNCSCFGEKQRELMAAVLLPLFHRLGFCSDRSTALARVPEHEDLSSVSKGQDETVIPNRG